MVMLHCFVNTCAGGVSSVYQIYFRLHSRFELWRKAIKSGVRKFDVSPEQPERAFLLYGGKPVEVARMPIDLLPVRYQVRKNKSGIIDYFHKVKTSPDTQKLVVITKLILSNMDSHTTGFHKFFKILYFAERDHVAQYGRTITGDQFVAMKDGPVPSVLYDLFKILKGNSIFNSAVDLSNDFRVDNEHYITMIKPDFDIDILAESEVECIVNAVQENKDLSFSILWERSHDLAWESAGKDDEMSIFDIARAGGANDELLKYMVLLSENQNLE